MASQHHIWVEINILPVSVEHDHESDSLITSASDEGMQLAFSGDDRQTICWQCKEHLTHELYHSRCPGEPEANIGSN